MYSPPVSITSAFYCSISSLFLQPFLFARTLFLAAAEIFLFYFRFRTGLFDIYTL